MLEVGGEVGTLQLELLRAGAGRAVSVELTTTYEDAAEALLRDHGLRHRVERRLADFVGAASDVEPADVVVLNRVVCCYPDMPRLTAAAADHTRRILVMSFPRRTWWTRAVLWVGNALLRVTRREFRVFIHPPASIRQVVENRGLRQSLDRRGLFWQVVAFEATPAAP